MRRFWCLVHLLAACILFPSLGDAQGQRCTSVATGVGVQVGGCNSSAAGTPARPGLPRNIQLPNGDFVWHWGTRPVDDDPDANDFSIYGSEQDFYCHLTGSFLAKFPEGVSDPSAWTRDFLASVSISERFVTDTTDELNRIFRDGSDSSWATLSCTVPDVLPTDEELDERADKALERARQQRERRRDR